VVVVVATTITILYLITQKERKYSRLLAHTHTSHTEERREKERREEKRDKKEVRFSSSSSSPRLFFIGHLISQTSLVLLNLNHYSGRHRTILL